MSTVDVVIPCYNYGRYLQSCVQSVLSQPEVEVRALILDDASSDDTATIGQRLAASDPRVSFRRHGENKGHIATYNEGLIGWSTADYCVLLSADDILAPGSLDRAVALMKAHPNVGLVYGATIHFSDESDLPASPSHKPGCRIWSGPDWVERRCRAGYNVITSPEVVVRGSVQRAVGGYRPELPHAGDIEMWLRIAAAYDIAYISGVPQAFYRVHPKSMMRTIYRGGFLDLRQRKAAFDSFFQNATAALANAAFLHDMANRSLAREVLWDACRAYDRDEVQEMNVQELVDFAIMTYPDAACLPEYAALRRRRWLGPKVCRRTQVFAFPALVHKVHRSALKRRWQKHGV